MRAIKHQMIGAGFAVFRATRLHKGLSPLTRGQGAILMLHHVRPWQPRAFAPNRLLEIEPAFLDAALTRIRQLGFDLVSLDEAARRIGTDAPPFVALTLDDGYTDALDHALPVLERHHAPFALFVTTGFADRTARLWWAELEAAIRTLDHVDLTVAGVHLSLPCADAAAKQAAFRTIYWMLRRGPEEQLLSTIADLACRAGVGALTEELCLDWNAIRRLSQIPLCTIGVHTLSHPMLAKHPPEVARREMAESRARIETEIGLPARHLSYPVGDLASAGPRDYAIAAGLGFASAVTTRPGMIFPGHRAQMTALPRLSVNGNWQSLASLEVLLSGVPFALWNRGRRVVA